MPAVRLSLIEHGRAAEWMTSLALVVLSVTLALPGDTLSLPSAAALAGMGVTEIGLAVPLSLVGMARLAALWANGAWRRSPMLRCSGAILGAGAFGALAGAYTWPAVEVDAPVPLASGLFFVLALADVLAAYRSGADARLARISRD
jgi:hypothetical protein